MTWPANGLIAEAVEICTVCRSAGFSVRLFGGIAARVVGRAWFESHPEHQRRAKDIDLVGRKENLVQLQQILHQRGYQEIRQISLETEGTRAFFRRDEAVIDYSGDELVFAQRLPLRARLECDFPTLSLTDLLLEKLQIVSPRSEQIVDFLALVGSAAELNIEKQYFAEILGRNWGYWHSAELFLGCVHEYCLNEDLDEIRKAVTALEALVREVPRSLQWHVRSFFGEALPWHGVVEPMFGE